MGEEGAFIERRGKGSTNIKSKNRWQIFWRKRSPSPERFLGGKGVILPTRSGGGEARKSQLPEKKKGGGAFFIITKRGVGEEDQAWKKFENAGKKTQVIP